jgi:hypothetical protein
MKRCRCGNMFGVVCICCGLMLSAVPDLHNDEARYPPPRPPTIVKEISYTATVTGADLIHGFRLADDRRPVRWRALDDWHDV